MRAFWSILLFLLAMQAVPNKPAGRKRGRAPRNAFEYYEVNNSGVAQIQRSIHASQTNSCLPKAVAFPTAAATVEAPSLQPNAETDGMFDLPQEFREHERNRLICCTDSDCPASTIDQQASELALWMYQATGSKQPPTPIAWDQYQTTYCVAERSGAAYLVSFRTVEFGDGPRAVSWCTCDHAHLFVRDTYCGTTSVPWRTEAEQERVHYCLHARALKVDGCAGTCAWKLVTCKQFCLLRP